MKNDYLLCRCRATWRSSALMCFIFLGCCAISRATLAESHASNSQGATSGPTKHQFVVNEEAGPPKRFDVAQPPLLRKETLVLRKDDVDRATLSLSEIVEQLQVPSPLAAARERLEKMNANADAQDSDRPTPLAVQRLYFNARMAMRERKSYDAIRQFEAALRLAPQEPRILRSLAEAYNSIGNPVRATQYFEELVEVSPEDVAALYTLGKISLDQRQYEDAVVYLDAAREALLLDANKQLREALNPLVAHRLGEALRRLKYSKASLEQFARYLTLERNFTSSSKWLPELVLLDRQQPAILVAVGDLYNQMDAPGQALAAYQRAQKTSGSLAQELLARQLYTMLRLKQDDQAVALLTQRIDQLGSQAGLLELVQYITDQGVSSKKLIAELKRLYQDNVGSSQLLRVMADVLPRDQAIDLLAEHLSKHPSDFEIFDTLIWRRVMPDNVAKSNEQQRTQGIEITLEAMAKSPEYASTYASRFIRDGDDPAAMGKALDAYAKSIESASAKLRSDLQVLRGLNYFREQDFDQAIDAFDQALQLDGESLAARMQLVKLMISRGRYERAEALLKPLLAKNINTPEIILLQAEMLLRRGQIDAASAVLVAAIRKGDGGTPGMAMLLATVQMREGDMVGAEQTLLEALDRYPTEEQIYRMLLGLYAPGDGSASLVNDAPRQLARLQTRLFRTLPNSRLATLLRARDLVVRGQVDRAEALLQALIKDDPQDIENVRLLMEIYLRFNRTDDAEALFLRLQQAQPNNEDVLQLGLALYQQLQNQDKLAEIQEQLLLKQPPSEIRSLYLAQLYVETDRAKQATAMLDEILDSNNEISEPLLLMQLLVQAWAELDDNAGAEKRFALLKKRNKQLESELSYMHAGYYMRRHEEAAYEKQLLKTLEIAPDHPGANNDLAYRWTVKNKNLKQAKTMVIKAVDAVPGAGPYLDSMGWVEYKLGNFEEAVRWLKRATATPSGNHPVIHDHLGDALYQTGDKDGALSAWRNAQRLLKQLDGEDLDPETQSLIEKVPQKIADFQAGNPVEVADVPTPEDVQDNSE